MNIFYTHHNPKICAMYHVNAHVIKQILEYAQLLSTAHRILDGVETIEQKYVEGSFPARYRKNKIWKLNDERDNILYKSTHSNHPSAIWTRQSDSNYKWLARLLVELCGEYTFRYGKIHKCESSGLVEKLQQIPNNIPKAEFTEPTPAMDIQYIVKEDSISSYRNYYNKAKQHLANWSGKINSRPIPDWYNINNFI